MSAVRSGPEHGVTTGGPWLGPWGGGSVFVGMPVYR
jgi:hypothetical protein